ncbi:MAG TPA: MmcQ/YjbR family DNA-binding protein, partial [Candidatus Acidoferrales bacterium]
MTGNEFRRIALSFPGAEEKEHMDHPDFRVGNKIFATLNYPDKTRGMVKLFPDQQQQMTQADPAMFEPVPGGWGKGGATRVHLKAAKAMKLREAMRLAWEKAAPKSKESKTKVK